MRTYTQEEKQAVIDRVISGELSTHHALFFTGARAVRQFCNGIVLCFLEARGIVSHEVPFRSRPPKSGGQVHNFLQYETSAQETAIQDSRTKGKGIRLEIRGFMRHVQID